VLAAGTLRARACCELRPGEFERVMGHYLMESIYARLVCSTGGTEERGMNHGRRCNCSRPQYHGKSDKFLRGYAST